MVASIGTPLMAPVKVNDPPTAANEPAGIVAENPPTWRVTSWVKGLMLPPDPGVNVPCTVNPPEAGWIWAAAEKAANGTMSASTQDRKSTRLNSSHGYISYAVVC